MSCVFVPRQWPKDLCRFTVDVNNIRRQRDEHPRKFLLRVDQMANELDFKGVNIERPYLPVQRRGSDAGKPTGKDRTNWHRLVWTSPVRNVRSQEQCEVDET